jgi:alpha-D-ribose 1-methylphosphonate 5-triphosphate synthase subunit PhnL
LNRCVSARRVEERTEGWIDMAGAAGWMAALVVAAGAAGAGGWFAASTQLAPRIAALEAVRDGAADADFAREGAEAEARAQTARAETAERAAAAAFDARESTRLELDRAKAGLEAVSDRLQALRAAAPESAAAADEIAARQNRRRPCSPERGA